MMHASDLLISLDPINLAAAKSAVFPYKVFTKIFMKHIWTIKKKIVNLKYIWRKNKTRFEQKYDVYQPEYKR